MEKQNGPIVKWYYAAFALLRRESDSPWVHTNVSARKTLCSFIKNPRHEPKQVEGVNSNDVARSMRGGQLADGGIADVLIELELARELRKMILGLLSDGSRAGHFFDVPFNKVHP